MAKRSTLALLAGALLSLLAAVGPAEAAFPGANGKIAYEYPDMSEPVNKRDHEIWSVNPDGSGNINLTDNDLVNDINPAWSPDGEKVVYASYPRNGDPDLFVMNADGTGQTRLTETPDNDELHPAWSPDGTKIAFTRVEKFNGGTADYYEQYDVFAINADGTGEVRLTNNPSRDLHPAWSPDGARIAFTSSRDANQNEIYVMGASPEGPSNEPVRLTNSSGDDYEPDWSPDGEKIAFVSERDRPRDHFGVPEIYKMNADGTRETRLTFRGNYYDPDWSPNGERLVFGKNVLHTMKAGPLGEKNRPRPVGSGIGYSYSSPDWQAVS